MVGWIAALGVLVVFWCVGAHHRLVRQRAAVRMAQDRLLACWRRAIDAMASALPQEQDSAPIPSGDAADRMRSTLGAALRAHRSALGRWHARTTHPDTWLALHASSERLLCAWTAAIGDAGDLAGPLVPDEVARTVAEALRQVEGACADFTRQARDYNLSMTQLPARWLASAIGLTPVPLLMADTRPQRWSDGVHGSAAAAAASVAAVPVSAGKSPLASPPGTVCPPASGNTGP